MSRILLVEDEKEFSDIIRALRKNVDMLFMGSAELVCLQTLDMARHVVKSGGVEIVIMDLSLPDSPQRQTVEMIIREHQEWPPIYVLTGDERIELRRECVLGGARGFAIKKHVVESPNFFFASIYNMHLKHLCDHGNKHRL